MPYLKQIAAHTNCQSIQNYLEKKDRALAKDFFNLSVDERDGYGDEGKDDVRWADEMDATRRRNGNDLPFGQMRARTYKHFIISPDPEDGIDLPALRELACSWALKHFDGYQIAIVYHDDNASNIPHAHIVVNNTDLNTGLRMHHDDPKEFNRSLQQMAHERGLLFLTDEAEPVEGLERLTVKERGRKAHPKTMQQVHIGRAEQGIIDAGAYSWVADIRNRVSVAKALARNEGEFRQVLGMLGVEVSDNSRSAKREDWIFSLADIPTQKVSGERLGLLFAKETIERQFKRTSAYRPDAKSSQELLRNARNAVLVNDLGDLSDLSQALRTCAASNVSSIQECDRKIAFLKKRADATEGPKRSSLQTSLAELQSARDYMAERNLLPQRMSRKSNGSAQGITSKRESAINRTTESTEQARQIELQQGHRERNER